LATVRPGHSRSRLASWRMWGLFDVAFHSLLVAYRGLIWVEPGCPAGPPLVQEIPALVQRDLEPLHPFPVRLRCLPLRLLLEQGVLFVRQLVDAFDDVLIFHGSDLLHPAECYGNSVPGLGSGCLRAG